MNSLAISLKASPFNHCPFRHRCTLGVHGLWRMKPNAPNKPNRPRPGRASDSWSVGRGPWVVEVKMRNKPNFLVSGLKTAKDIVCRAKYAPSQSWDASAWPTMAKSAKQSQFVAFLALATWFDSENGANQPQFRADRRDGSENEVDTARTRAHNRPHVCSGRGVCLAGPICASALRLFICRPRVKVFEQEARDGVK